METGDLFSTPAPTPPTARQEVQVLERLAKGPVTPAQAYSELGVMRLAAVVLRLKDRGYGIATDLVDVTCREGRTARVAQYRLTPRPH